MDKYAGVKPYYKNFGPRFGFAYQLYPHTVVRGGFGIFYNPTGSEGGSLRLFRQLPFGSTVNDLARRHQCRAAGQRWICAAAAGRLRARRTIRSARWSPWISNFRPSYAEQFNLTLEHEIAPWALVVKTAVVGNLGRHLYNTYNANQPIPGAAALEHPAAAVSASLRPSPTSVTSLPTG